MNIDNTLRYAAIDYARVECIAPDMNVASKEYIGVFSSGFVTNIVYLAYLGSSSEQHQFRFLTNGRYEGRLAVTSLEDSNIEGKVEMDILAIHRQARAAYLGVKNTEDDEADWMFGALAENL